MTGRRVREADLLIALLYIEQNPQLDRGSLGLLLEKDGMGLDHYLIPSNCRDRVEYINLILDRIGEAARTVTDDLYRGE